MGALQEALWRFPTDANKIQLRQARSSARFNSDRARSSARFNSDRARSSARERRAFTTELFATHTEARC
jgi:hypothetical protein